MQKYIHLVQIVETEKVAANQLRTQLEDQDTEIERLKSEVDHREPHSNTHNKVQIKLKMTDLKIFINNNTLVYGLSEQQSQIRFFIFKKQCLQYDLSVKGGLSI